jgi:choline/glycine/proline betaine transport protein
MKRIFSHVNTRVFIPSLLIIALIVLTALILGAEIRPFVRDLNDLLVNKLGWFYILSMSFYLIVAFFLLFSKFGDIRLGPDNSKAEFRYSTWLAMLYSAGMGIGLLFYGVAEPIMHFARPAPPLLNPSNAEATHNAMGITLFHWGFHPWACYALVGLCLAYFAYRKNLPFSLRSALYPFIGDKIYGWRGDLVDITAIVSTLFGVATSLGLGALQINSGLSEVFKTPNTSTIQVIIILVITLAATISVVTGLKKGVKLLSEFNMLIALGLLLAVFFLGPTTYLLNSMVENVGIYLQTLPRNSFWTASLNETRQEWLGNWTVFYWAWWIAWSPFVGMFLARISKGRSIREFTFGVLVVPVVMSLIWFSVFGNTAIYFETHQIHPLIQKVSNNIPAALFYFFDAFPWAIVLKITALTCVILFFITSSDSASLVIDILSSGGKGTPHKSVKVFWATAEGLVAAALLFAGELRSLQLASLTTALPFALIISIAGMGLLKALSKETA